MSSAFKVDNAARKSLWVQCMSADAEGRLTHAYKIEVPAGAAIDFSSGVGSLFLVSETEPSAGVYLPRGVPPVDVEAPNAVTVNSAAAAEKPAVAEATTDAT